MKKTKQTTINYELMQKDKRITLRMSTALLKEIKLRSKKMKIDYQKFIRMSLEAYLR